MFNVNQIVSGKNAGKFVVLGYRTIAGESMVQLKPYNPLTNKVGRGEICLPIDSIKEI